MRRCFAVLFAILGLLLPVPGMALEPIRFPRTPDISPDGKWVAFSYLGDIWLVESIGGTARQLTSHEAHEIHPVFSPDGKSIAFSSNRHGSYDVFVMPVYGGKPTRLTFDSAQEMVYGWSPDGRSILYTSTRSTAYPFAFELYTVPVVGGAERKLPIAEAKEGAFSPDGKMMAYIRGPGTWYRKGYRGSANDDLWLAALDGSFARRITDFPGLDAAPMWSPDQRKLYFVSEMFGTANIVCQDLTANWTQPIVEGKPRQITQHQEDGVRRARLSADGKTFVYECGGDLWTHSLVTGQSRKLVIEAFADDKGNSERTVTYTNSITDYAISPDEQHVVTVTHGELFLSKFPLGGKATQLTDSPAFDHGVRWSPDGKKLLFLSDRTGVEDLYLLEPDDPEHPELIKAHKFKVTQLTHTPEEERAASFSPDGSRIAFIRSGKLFTMKPDGTELKTIVDQPQVFDYDWSPDSKWLAVAKFDGSYASEVFILPSNGGEMKNVTRYATFNGDVTWSNTNHKISFLSQRRGVYGMHVLSLQKPAAPGAPASNDIDWDDIHLRVERAAGISAEGGTISPDGTRVAFRSTANGDDLWLASSDGRSLFRLTNSNLRPRHIHWLKRGVPGIVFLDRDGALRVVRAGVAFPAPTPMPEPDRFNLQAKLTIRQNEEFLEMFDQSWRILANYFYDPQFHGVNWQSIREKYRPMVAHVAMKEDLYALISLMLGELNSSHLGISGPGRTPSELTADLGILFDETYRGPGLKIAEILKRGPADKRGIHLQPGDLLLSIDRVPLNDQANLSRLLNGKAGETVLLEVTSNPADPKASRKFELQPIARTQAAELMYERWITRNAQMVHQLSNGRLGYVHIPSMDEAGLERFIRGLYSDTFDKEGLVLDIRYNGGGYIHDEVLTYLSGKEHTYFKQRDGGEGLVVRQHHRRWTKPSVLLINNRSFSDAEVFPSAYRTLGLGKLVGQPTGGSVIFTYQTTLIDGSTFRIPRTGVYTLKGVNMEREGVMPDVLVEPMHDEAARGVDSQLSKAVEVLLRDVAEWKKNRVPITIGVPGAAPNATK